MMNEYSTKHLFAPVGITTAVSLLKDGHCVALPTETVYGLAANASNGRDVQRIFQAKGRPSNHPLIVHLSECEAIRDWAVDIPDTAWELLNALGPGPLTLLLKKAPHVPSEVTGGLSTIALRIPAHPIFHQVLQAFGGGLAAPSANPYKHLSPTAAEHVLYNLNGKIAAVLDGGNCEHGLESTILDLNNQRPRILRAGPIGREEIEKILGSKVEVPQGFNDAVPGNVEAHYQPQTALRLVDKDTLLNILDLKSKQQVHYIVHSSDVESHLLDREASWTKMPDNPSDYGRLLYACLFQADRKGHEHIVMQHPPTDEPWHAVNDRLMRAAHR